MRATTSMTAAARPSRGIHHMQAQPLAGKTAFITGASGSIGSASARLLAADGAAVLLMSRREDALAKLKAEIEKETPGAVVAIHAGNATKVDAVRAGLDKAHAL